MSSLLRRGLGLIDELDVAGRRGSSGGGVRDVAGALKDERSTAHLIDGTAVDGERAAVCNEGGTGEDDGGAGGFGAAAADGEAGAADGAAAAGGDDQVSGAAHVDGATVLEPRAADVGVDDAAHVDAALVGAAAVEA